MQRQQFQLFHLATIEPVQCECKSTDVIPLCSSVGYNQTYQNFRGLSIIETNIELSSYQSLIDTSCSDYLINLLCSVYAPPCNGTDPVIKLRPCRALCRKVKDDCWSNLDIYDNWPELFDCENNSYCTISEWWWVFILPTCFAPWYVCNCLFWHKKLKTLSIVIESW